MKRPLSVIIIACLYMAVGAIGFVFHFQEFWARNSFHYDFFLIELTELVALLFGIFLVRGHNWARWGAIAWMLFHVAFSAFDALPKLAIHAVFFVVIAYCLFRPGANRYFRGTRNQAT